MGDFGQRVGLVHKLAQRVGTEECVDNRRYGLGVDKVDWSEHLVVAHIHALANGARHTRQTDTELVVQLLAYSTYSAVAQVVDVVNVGFAVDKLYQILDNGNDVFLGEDTHVHRGIKSEFFVDTVATYFAEIVTLVGEEEVLYHFTCRSFIRRLGVAQLSVDVNHGFLLGVRGILLQGIEYDGVIRAADILLVQEYGLLARIYDILYVAFVEHGFAVDYNLVALDRNYFSGILIREILEPGLQHTCGELAAHCSAEISLVHLDFLGKTENFNNILITFQTDSTKQSGYRELFLTVDVGIHHIVDVSGEFNPRATERNNTCRIQLSAVGMSTLTEEHARRTVQLRYNHTLSTIYHKGAFLGHVRNRAQIHVLDLSVEILMIGVSTVKFELCFQRHAIGQTALQTFVD